MPNWDPKPPVWEGIPLDLAPHVAQLETTAKALGYDCHVGMKVNARRELVVALILRPGSPRSASERRSGWRGRRGDDGDDVRRGGELARVGPRLGDFLGRVRRELSLTDGLHDLGGATLDGSAHAFEVVFRNPEFLCRCLLSETLVRKINNFEKVVKLAQLR